MARTLEGIVQAHSDARALRAAGKPIWSKTITLKDLFNDDDSPEALSAVAIGVAARIRQALPVETFDVTSDSYDQTMDEVVDDLETMTVEQLTGIKDAQEIINGRLEEIYDWADSNRVWIG